MQNAMALVRSWVNDEEPVDAEGLGPGPGVAGEHDSRGTARLLAHADVLPAPAPIAAERLDRGLAGGEAAGAALGRARESQYARSRGEDAARRRVPGRAPAPSSRSHRCRPPGRGRSRGQTSRGGSCLARYSTVTLLARFLGWSTLQRAPLATWYANSWRGTDTTTGEKSSAVVGTRSTCCASESISASSSEATAMTSAPGPHLLDVGEQLRIHVARGRDRDDREAGFDQRDRPVLQLPPHSPPRGCRRSP